MKEPTPTDDCGPRFWLAVKAAQVLSALLFLYAFAKANRLDGMLDAAAKWLYHWQTLVAGLLALYGAMRTVETVRRQISQNEKASNDQLAQADRHQREHRERQHRAARAELPPALKSLDNYTTACLKLLRSVPLAGPGRILLKEGENVDAAPEVPPEALVVLRKCIETVDVESNYVALATLLEKLQIQNSRLQLTRAHIEPPTPSIVIRHTIESDAADLFEIRQRMNAIWVYARRLTDQIAEAITADSMKTDAFFQDFQADEYPHLAEMLEKRVEEPAPYINFETFIPRP